jgi:hypothetical protein
MLEVAYRLSQHMVGRLCVDVRCARPVGCSRETIIQGGEEAVGEGEEAGEEGSVMRLELKIREQPAADHRKPEGRLRDGPSKAPGMNGKPRAKNAPQKTTK